MACTMEALNLPVTRPPQDLQNEDVKPGGSHGPHVTLNTSPLSGHSWKPGPQLAPVTSHSLNYMTRLATCPSFCPFSMPPLLLPPFAPFPSVSINYLSLPAFLPCPSHLPPPLLPLPVLCPSGSPRQRAAPSQVKQKGARVEQPRMMAGIFPLPLIRAGQSLKDVGWG